MSTPSKVISQTGRQTDRHTDTHTHTHTTHTHTDMTKTLPLPHTWEVKIHVPKHHQTTTCMAHWKSATSGALFGIGSMSFSGHNLTAQSIVFFGLFFMWVSSLLVVFQDFVSFNLGSSVYKLMSCCTWDQLRSKHAIKCHLEYNIVSL